MERLIGCILIAFTLLVCGCNNRDHEEKKPIAIDSNRVPKKDTPVVVIKKNIPDSTYKIYISIDDGPDMGSANINQVALDDSAKINLFIVGWQVYKKDTLRKFFEDFQSNPFIEIGSHSYTHAQLHYRRYYKKPIGVIRDFELNADTLHLQNKLIRFPGRNTWRIHGKKKSDLPDDTVEADSLAAEGYSIFGWDIEWRHFPENSHTLQTADNIMQRIAAKIRDGKSFTPGHIVILAHDTSFIGEHNKQQLDQLIKKIKAKKNYRLEFLSNYP